MKKKQKQRGTRRREEEGGKGSGQEGILPSHCMLARASSLSLLHTSTSFLIYYRYWRYWSSSVSRRLVWKRQAVTRISELENFEAVLEQCLVFGVNRKASVCSLQLDSSSIIISPHLSLGPSPPLNMVMLTHDRGMSNRSLFHQLLLIACY